MSDPLIGGTSAAQAVVGASAAPETMEEFVASRNGGAPQPPTAASEPESAPGAEAAADALRTPEQDGSEPEGSGKAVKELIHTRKRAQEAEREAAYWRGLAEGRAGAGAPQEAPEQVRPQGPPPRPEQEDFETYEEFNAARERWMDDMVDYRAAQIRDSVLQRTVVDSVQQAFVRRLDEAVKGAPQLNKAFDVVGRAISQPMADYIKLSPQGPQLLLYLHQHMDDTARLAKTHPVLALGELGQIAAKFAAPATPAPPAAPAPQKSNAPPPVKPVVNNGAPVEVPLDKMEIDEFMATRNKAQYGR